jgi:copper chaperone CopZ
MKKTFFLLVFFAALQAHAQIKSANLQASGLTCSMCSKAIYKALVAIPFVKQVTSNIQQSTYQITFKENAEVNIDALDKAVAQAGFSISKLMLTMQFKQAAIENDAHVVIGKQTYHFIQVKPPVLDGEQVVTVIDKHFVPVKEYKLYSKQTTMKCYATGVMEDCCSKKHNNLNQAQRIIHVTI